MRRKTAAVLTLQAEVEALREAVAEKAAEIAKLQDGLAGAEPAGRELESTQAEIARLEARLRVADEEHLAAIATAAARESELLESRKEIVIRDTRINDLRNRCASLETELAAARDAASSPGGQDLGRPEEDDDDVRQALRRQIERNRKQEAVHRSVVEQLEGEKARLRAETQAIPERTNRK